MLHTSRKIRGGDALTWKWFTGEDKQIHQNLLQHPVLLQSSVRLAPTPQAPCTTANPLLSLCVKKAGTAGKKQGLPLYDKPGGTSAWH